MKHLLTYWDQKTDGISIHLLRIAFCFILALQLYDFYFTTTAFALVPFHLTYDFFHFVRPVSGTLAIVVYTIFCVAAVLAALGIAFRPSLFVALIGLTYSFLIDQTLYNNHYYLFILVSILFLFTDAGSGITIFHPRTTATIPMRQLWMLRFMVCLVYFYGGVNKLNYDWLVYAEPVYTWLPDMLGSWVTQLSPRTYTILAFIIAYSGMLLDLLSGIFLMFENRLKYILLPVLIIFHCMNATFFNIGYFPYFSLAALLLFIDPDKLKERLAYLFPATLPVSSGFPVAGPLLLGSFVVIQLLIPLRHWLIPGYYLWHERGILFSWTMKLRDKEPIINISYRVAGDPHDYEVPIHRYTCLRQLRHLGYRPMDLVQFAHYLEDTLGRQYVNRDIEVYAEIYTCLNHYRPYQLLINPYIDLTKINVQNKLSIEDYKWIVPLGGDHFGLTPPADLLQHTRREELPPHHDRGKH